MLELPFVEVLADGPAISEDDRIWRHKMLDQRNEGFLISPLYCDQQQLPTMDTVPSSALNLLFSMRQNTHTFAPVLSA